MHCDTNVCITSEAKVRILCDTAKRMYCRSLQFMLGHTCHLIPVQYFCHYIQNDEANIKH